LYTLNKDYILLFSSKLYPSAEYWVHFTALFGGDHAFGSNSTESKPIRMKSGYIVGGWPWQVLGAICPVATAKEPGEILFVCFLSCKQCTISPTSRRQNITKFKDSV